MTTLTRGLTGMALAAALLSAVIAPTTGLAGSLRAQHVLLISIDGFHAVDLEVCVAAGTCPNLAILSQSGVTYTNASTTKPHDSFPGLLNQLNNVTPHSTAHYTAHR